MQMTAHGKKQPSKKMISSIILFFSLLLIGYSGYAQNITLSLKKVPLEKAFREIERKTDHRFVYTKEMTAIGNPVTVQVRNSSLQNILDLIFKSQPLEFTVDEKFIAVKFKPNLNSVSLNSERDIYGKVVDEKGEAVVGATVLSRGRNRATATDSNGNFFLNEVNENDVLIITCVGYSRQEIAVKEKNNFIIYLSILATALDEKIVIAYGTNTQRLSTGNVSRVTATEISRQPSANPLAFLQGRVPGLDVTQSNGLPGSSFKIQVRGRNSIAQGSEPLFIIDGVPYAPGNNFLNQISSAIGVSSSIPNFSSGLSPFSLINPADIESIEVLKDADATAIYGSRGANGVILITTKKGKEGKTRVAININNGWGKITRTMDMLNTSQYVQMRNEAFINDGLTPSVEPSDPGYAPDLLVWDNKRYTDFKKLLIGGTARTSNAQASLSGGSSNVQFLLGATYRYQSTVFPGDFTDKQGSFHLNLNHLSFCFLQK